MSDTLTISRSNFITFPYQQAAANLKSAFSSEQQNFFKRIARIVFAILEIIPVAGLFVATLDSKWFFQNRITSATPKPTESPAPAPAPTTPTAPEEAAKRDYRKIVIGSVFAAFALGTVYGIASYAFGSAVEKTGEEIAKGATEQNASFNLMNYLPSCLGGTVATETASTATDEAAKLAADEAAKLAATLAAEKAAAEAAAEAAKLAADKAAEEAANIAAGIKGKFAPAVFAAAV